MKRIVVILASLSVLGLVGSGPRRVSADPWGSCSQNTSPVGAGVSLSVDGTPITGDSNYEYGDYTLVVCRDSSNKYYIVNIGRIGGSGGSARELTEEDLAKTFVVTFTPTAGDVPHLVEGHGLTQSFTVDPLAGNTVTVAVKPLAYSDIWGNDCGNKGPIECVKLVSKASHDSVAAIWFSVRYEDQNAPASEFSLMSGMTWSSSAYDFWPRYSCPTQSNGQPTNGIQLEIAGPHFKADGVTPNIGYARVFIPTVAVINCWGALPADVLAQLKVTRTENGTTQTAVTGNAADNGLEYSAEVTEDGLVITLPTITFSAPKYTMKTRTGKALMRSKTSISTLARAHGIVTPKGGRVKVMVSKSSAKYCLAGTSSVFGRRAGTCSYTITSYRKNGTKVKSAKGSFKVR